jgi:hypothetical protein
LTSSDLVVRYCRVNGFTMLTFGSHLQFEPQVLVVTSTRAIMMERLKTHKNVIQTVICTITGE